jgi:hypothetical protein
MNVNQMNLVDAVSQESGRDKIVLIYEWAMKKSEREALLKIVNAIPRTRAISISQNILELGSNLNKSKNDNTSRIDAFREVFNEFCTTYDGDYPEIFANKYMHFQFDRMSQEMEKTINYGDFFSTLLAVARPSLVIFAHEAFTIERTLVGLARNEGVPTASIFHGSLGQSAAYQGRCGDVDHIFVWNDDDVVGLSSFGIQLERIQKIGCIRYEEQYNEYIKNYGEDYSLLKSKDKKLIGLDKNRPVITLLTAAINTGYADPCADPCKHREALRGFLSLVESRADLQFVIKAHPGYDYHDLYKTILEPRLPNLFFNEEIGLNSILDATDICFMMNYCTTASLEALLHKVPVIFFDNAIYQIPGWVNSFSDRDIHHVANISELEIAIDELLENSPSREKANQDTNNLLKFFLGIEKKSAKDRLFGSIEHLINNQADNDLNNQNPFLGIMPLNSSKATQSHDELISKHDSISLMFVFAFISGAFNHSSNDLHKIYQLFDMQENNLPWEAVRWHLIKAHVEGYNKCSVRSLSLNWFRALILYFFHPKKFVIEDSCFKISLTKYMLNQMFGNNILSLVRYIYFYSKKFFVTRRFNA